MSRPITLNQQQFIQTIEADWGFPKFTGKTFQEAHQYIAHYKSIYDRLPNRRPRLATPKQLAFIKIIEEQWGFPKFTGRTLDEAKQYIAKCKEQQAEWEFEQACYHDISSNYELY